MTNYSKMQKNQCSTTRNFTDTDYKIIWKVDHSSYPKEDIELIEGQILRDCREDKELGVHRSCGDYQVSYRTLPKSRTAEVNYIAKFKFFDWRKNFPQDKNSMFINAQSDFVNYLILDYINEAPMGTSLWLVHQSIEKYLKAILLKSGVLKNEELRKKKYGHNLITLFEHFKASNPASDLFQNESYETLVRELDTGGENTGIRYAAGIHINEPFTRIFIEVCTILRLEFLGSEAFLKYLPYGLGGRGEQVAKIMKSAHSKHRITDEFLKTVLSSSRKKQNMHSRKRGKGDS